VSLTIHRVHLGYDSHNHPGCLLDLLFRNMIPDPDSGPQLQTLIPDPNLDPKDPNFRPQFQTPIGAQILVKSVTYYSQGAVGFLQS
jgi:hypothetical protein